MRNSKNLKCFTDKNLAFGRHQFVFQLREGPSSSSINPEGLSAERLLDKAHLNERNIVSRMQKRLQPSVFEKAAKWIAEIEQKSHNSIDQKIGRMAQDAADPSEAKRQQDRHAIRLTILLNAEKDYGLKGEDLKALRMEEKESYIFSGFGVNTDNRLRINDQVDDAVNPILSEAIEKAIGNLRTASTNARIDVFHYDELIAFFNARKKIIEARMNLLKQKDPTPNRLGKIGNFQKILTMYDELIRRTEDDHELDRRDLTLRMNQEEAETRQAAEAKLNNEVNKIA